MRALCHRCHGELPDSPRTANGTGSYDERALFCPLCGAPQLLLPDHLRATLADEAAGTTGMLPPPHPSSATMTQGGTDWRMVLKPALAVAAVGAGLTVLGLRLPPAAFFSTLWIVGAPLLVLGLYTRNRPEAAVDAYTGLRVGVATGLLMLAAVAIGMAVAGTFVRFAAHGMQDFDAQVAQQMEMTRAQVAARLTDQNQDRAFQQRMLGYLGSDEMRGGLAVAYAAMLGGLILLFSAAGGAFGGLMHRVRQAAAARRAQR